MTTSEANTAPRSSSPETVTTGYISRVVGPIARLTTVPATVAALLWAHTAMHADVPSYLVVTTIVLSVVVPGDRQAVRATLCALYGLAFLPVGFAHAAFSRKDRGECLIQGLARITSLLSGDPLPDWASAPAAGQAATATVPAPPLATSPVSGSVQTGVADQPGSGTTAEPVSTSDFLPPARNAAREMSEPIHDSVLTDLARDRPTGPQDIADKPRGRHARAKSELEKQLVPYDGS